MYSIEDAAQVLADLQSKCKDFSSILDREEEAIIRNDFKVVTDVCPIKHEMQASLQEKVKNLQDIWKKVFLDKKSVKNDPKNLSEWKHFISSLDRDSFLNKNFSKECFLKNVDQFLQEFHYLKFRVERNRLVLQKLIQNYQQSLHFWADVVAEKKSSYTSRGFRKDKNISTQVTVKA